MLAGIMEVTLIGGRKIVEEIEYKPNPVKTFEEAKTWAKENFKRVADSYSKKYVTLFTVDRF